MKTLRLLLALALFTGYISSLSSCSITFKSDNGKHKGWFKNPKNPHHPKSTHPKTPSKGKGNGKGNGKGKK